MIMRKMIRLFSCFLALLILSGCSFIPSRLGRLTSEMKEMKSWNMTTSEQILECLSSTDENAFKELFCPKTLALSDTDRQIAESFEFFKGKVVSFDDYVSGPESTSYSYGQIILQERAWDISNVVTDAGQTYEIHVQTYLVCDEDKEREGLGQITISCITDKNDKKEMTIGYGWPLHYDEGRDWAALIVRALDSRDALQLNFRFCDQIREEETIDQEVQACLDFIEGRVTFGKAGKINGHQVVDLNHSYSTTVIDKEIVENSIPTQTYIAVKMTNIEMDNGKIYQAEYYGCLLDVNDRDTKGVWALTVSDEEGNSRTIGHIEGVSHSKHYNRKSSEGKAYN